MLTGRLVRVTKDVVTEYDQFKIFELIESALSILTANPQNGDAIYGQRAPMIRQRSEEIIENSKIKDYPEYLSSFLNESDYFQSLPVRIATFLLNGFPPDRARAISSPELKYRQGLAQGMYGDFRGFILTTDRFHIQETSAAPDRIGIDLLIPRFVINNNAAIYADILRRFIRIASFLSELSTGSKDFPILTYTSTSDPVTGLALLGAAALAVLNFYKQALEAAEKTINFLKLLKDFKKSGLKNPPDLEKERGSYIDDTIEKAVSDAIDSIAPKVEAIRINEIKNAISIDAKIVIKAITNGVRVGVSIESIGHLTLITEGSTSLTTDVLREMLEQQKSLERRVEESLLTLGGADLGLIGVEVPVVEESKAEKQER